MADDRFQPPSASSSETKRETAEAQDIQGGSALTSEENEDDLADQISQLKEQRIELDEQLADMTHRLRELSHMEQSVRADKAQE